MSVFTLMACNTIRQETPSINARNAIMINDGDEFDPIRGFIDDEDTVENATHNLHRSKLSANRWVGGPGIFDYTITVTENNNNAYQVVRVYVNYSNGSEATAPILEGAYVNQAHYLGSNAYQPLSGVVALDSETNEDISDEISILGTVLSTRVGRSSFTIEVQNSQGVTRSVAVSLTVKAQVDIIEDSFEDVLLGYTTENPLEITMWHANGDSISARLTQYARDFEELHDNRVKVNIVKQESTYSELKDTTVRGINLVDQLPNLIQTYPDHVMEYLAYRRVLSVSPYMHHPVHGYSTTDENDMFSDIVPIYRMENSQYTHEGDFYALPFNKSTEVMAYNKTVYDRLVAKGKAPEEFPETWQDLFALSEAYEDEVDAYFAEIKAEIFEKGRTADRELYSDANITLMTNRFVPFSYDSPANAFITLTRQWGGEYTGIDEHRRGLILFDNDQTKNMLTYFRNNRDKLTVPGNWGDSYDYASDIFKYGYTFATVGSTGGIRYNTPVEFTDGTPLFEIGVVPVPYNKEMPENRTVIQQGTNVSMLNVGNDEQKLASWYFLKYLTSHDVQLDFATSIGYSPVRTSVYETPAFIQFTNGLNADGEALTGEALTRSKGLNAAAQQRLFQFYDQAFIGSSIARAAVEVAFNQVVISENQNIINIALQQAKDTANRVLGN